jgi:hypothetical protein
MYVNAKMIPVEIFSGIRGGGCRRSMEGVSSRMIFLNHCKIFLNAKMYSYPALQ